MRDLTLVHIKHLCVGLGLTLTAACGTNGAQAPTDDQADDGTNGTVDDGNDDAPFDAATPDLADARIPADADLRPVTVVWPDKGPLYAGEYQVVFAVTSSAPGTTVPFGPDLRATLMVEPGDTVTVGIIDEPYDGDLYSFVDVQPGDELRVKAQAAASPFTSCNPNVSITGVPAYGGVRRAACGQRLDGSMTATLAITDDDTGLPVATGTADAAANAPNIPVPMTLAATPFRVRFSSPDRQAVQYQFWADEPTSWPYQVAAFGHFATELFDATLDFPLASDGLIGQARYSEYEGIARRSLTKRFPTAEGQAWLLPSTAFPHYFTNLARGLCDNRNVTFDWAGAARPDAIVLTGWWNRGLNGRGWSVILPPTAPVRFPAVPPAFRSPPIETQANCGYEIKGIDLSVATTYREALAHLPADGVPQLGGGDEAALRLDGLATWSIGIESSEVPWR